MNATKTDRMLGVTLIEMLVVLVLIGVLMAVVLPSYKDNARKSARAAARGALMDVSMRQQQYFLNNKSYATSLAGLGLPDPYFIDGTNEAVGSSDSSRLYKLTLANASATAYDAVATAVLDQTEDGCGNFTLKSDGARAVSGLAGAAVCW